MYTKEEEKIIRKEFWDRFERYSTIRRRQKGLPARWIMNKTGIRQLKLKFEFTTDYASVGIDIETRNTDRRIELYGKLEELKKVLEEYSGKSFNWELEYILPNGKSISRIFIELPGVSIYNKDSWDQVFPFFFKNMMKIEKFYDEYRDVLKY